MSITIEHALEATPEVHDLIGELNDGLGAAYEVHQRHGLSIEQLSESNVLSSWRGWTASRWAAAVSRCSMITPRSRGCTPASGAWSGSCEGSATQDRGRARRAGKSVLRLETGSYQQAAIGLYERTGFRPRSPFGPYGVMPARNIETSLFFEKVLP